MAEKNHCTERRDCALVSDCTPLAPPSVSSVVDGIGMSTQLKRWLQFGTLSGVLVLMVLYIGRKPIAVSEAVAISLVTYTNAVDSSWPFALFTISNQAAYPIRWRGNWMEVEGSSNHLARIQNRSLPHQYSPVLNSRGSFLLAVGEPADLLEQHWRFSMTYSRYTLKERWLDLSFRHNLPLKLGPFVLVDSQKILSPSNRVTVSSEWLGKNSRLTSGSSQ